MHSVLAGNLTVIISPDGAMNRQVMRPVHLTIEFSEDRTLFRLLGGWPAVLFDDSAPLSPARNSLRVNLSSSELGTIDLDGHFALRVALKLDYEPNLVFGKHDLN